MTDIENDEIVSLLREILRNQQAGLEIRAKAFRNMKWALGGMVLFLCLFLAISLLFSDR